MPRGGDHLRFRWRAARKRVRGQSPARRAADRPRPSEQRRGRDQALSSGYSGPQISSTAIEAVDRRSAAAGIPRARARSRPSARFRKASARSLARSISCARFRRTCRGRWLRRARRAGFAPTSIISASPMRSATMSTAAASMSSAASRRPTFTCLPPTQLEVDDRALRDHRGFGGRARPAHSRRARG